MRVNISLVPQHIEEIKSAPTPFCISQLQECLSSSSFTKTIANNRDENRAYWHCLLLLSFLAKEDSKYNDSYHRLLQMDNKANGIKLKIYDLQELKKFSEKRIEQKLIGFNYEELIRLHYKRKLLLPNLIGYKYERLLLQANKYNDTLELSQVVELLELIIDWKYRIATKSQFLKVIRKCLSVKSLDSIFWKERNIYNSKKQAGKKVKVAVWDTGVDAYSFHSNSISNGLYYDHNCNTSLEPLLPLKEYSYKELLLYKGWKDLIIGKENRTVTSLLHQMAFFTPEQIRFFRQFLNFFSLYTHGTMVASVITNNNPSVEIFPIRMTFDAKSHFPTFYTMERAKQEVVAYQQIFKTIQQNNIRLVNISWSYPKDLFDLSLRNNGISNKKSKRKGEAIFELLKKQMIEGIQQNPNTLFIVSAGNIDQLLGQKDRIPNSLSLPNLLPVGAVNSRGKQTSFTCNGNKVPIFANGDFIPCIAPHSIKMTSSGTSYAAPNVTNLAARILGKNPNFSALEVRQIILQYATETEEDIKIVHPKNTMQYLENEQNNWCSRA